MPNPALITFLSEPVSKPGHVTVAVEGVGDQVQRLQAGQLVKRTGCHTATNIEQFTCVVGGLTAAHV